MKIIETAYMKLESIGDTLKIRQKNQSAEIEIIDEISGSNRFYLCGEEIDEAIKALQEIKAAIAQA